MSTGPVPIRYRNILKFHSTMTFKFKFLDLYKRFFYLNLQEYSKSQIVGLINLVATMKGWKRKTRLEVLEKIE